jgi:hypothetical protein
MRKQTTFNFQARFAPMVADETKSSTIRIFDKTLPPEKGDTLNLFTGMRSSKCRLLKQPVCRDCQPIQITPKDIIVGGRKLSLLETEHLAKADGSASADHLRVFFIQTYGLPLPGKPHLVSW